MILRLAFVTIFLALFAVSFSAIVEYDGRSANAFMRGPAAGCFDQGAVCAPKVSDPASAPPAIGAPSAFE